MAQNQIIPRRPWKIETTHRGVVTHSLRTTAAWLLRLKRELYARITDKPIGNDLLADYIDANEYDAALLALISLAQRHEFGSLVKAFKRHPYHKIESGECGENLKLLMKPIVKYCPFVEAGIVRIGGRLQHSGESYDVKANRCLYINYRNKLRFNGIVVRDAMA